MNFFNGVPLFSRFGKAVDRVDDASSIRALQSLCVYNRNGIRVDILELSDGSWEVMDARGRDVKSKFFRSRHDAEAYCRSRGVFEK